MVIFRPMASASSPELFEDSGLDLSGREPLLNFLDILNSSYSLIGSDRNDFLFAFPSAPGPRHLKGDNLTFIWGKAGDDVLFGGGSDDVLKGGKGNDLLDGGGGKDKLVGGKGHDVFLFRPDYSALLRDGAIDRITDFTRHDTIALIAGHTTISNPNWSALMSGVWGESQSVINNITRFLDTMDNLSGSSFTVDLDYDFLEDSAFHIGKVATTSDHRVIYHRKSGMLFFDGDGSGPEEQVGFAKVEGGSELQAHNFVGNFELLLS